MTKIIVISDSHGDIYYAKKVLNKEKNIDTIIHLGDYFKDAQSLSSMYPDINFEYVYGNCDFMIGEIPSEIIIDIEGIKILVCHGHRYSIKWGLERVIQRGKIENVDLILYGHTHIPEHTLIDGIHIINPGSITLPRGGHTESYAVLEIENTKFNYKIKNAV